MTTKIGQNQNTGDSSTISTVALNPTTSTVVIAANERRVFFYFGNNTNKDVWLKLQTAATDNLKKGIKVLRGSYWEMPMGSTYIGEISAITDAGNVTIDYTEF